MRKWFILACYSALVYSNGYAFSAISTVTDKAEDYYNVSSDRLNLFVFTFYVFYLPVSPFASWFLTKSLHKSLMISFIVTGLGIWLKVIAGGNFWIALAGQCTLCSVTSLVLTAVSVIAETWFPKSQHLLAITIGELMTFLGMGSSFLISSEISIELDNWLQASLISVSAGIYLIFAREEPNKQQSLKLSAFFRQIWNLFKDRMHIFLATTVGAITGLSYSFLGLIGVALHSKGIISEQASVIGFLVSILGIAGGITVTLIEHKGISVLASLVIFFLSCSGSLLIWSILNTGLVADYFLGGIVGFFLFGIIPLGLRVTVDFNKKIADSIPTGIIFFTAQLFALVFSYSIIYAPDGGMNSLWAIFIFFVIFGVILIILAIIISKNSKKEELVDVTGEREILITTQQINISE